MNDLIEIYRRIEYLRNNGLKMKRLMALIFCRQPRQQV